MDTVRNTSSAEALAHLGDADEVFVRLALSRDDTGKWIFRSLAVDVLPKLWLNNDDTSLLTPWLQDQRRFECPTAFFFCGLVKSRTVRSWFAFPDDCGLAGFDERQGYAARRVSFSLPDRHDNVALWRLESYSRNGAKPIPYPNTLYVFTPKQPPNMQFRDDDRLVGEDGETFPSFRAARAELIYGMTNRRDMAYSREDTLALRVVDARGWLKEVRVTHDRLLITVGGTDILRGAYIAAQGPGVNERALLSSHHASLVLPSRISDQIEVVLMGSGSVLDAVTIYSTDNPYANYPAPVLAPDHVISEREDVVGRVISLEEVRALWDGVVEREDVAGYTPSSRGDVPAQTQTKGLPSEGSAAPRPKVFISYSHKDKRHLEQFLQHLTPLVRDGRVEVWADTKLKAGDDWREEIERALASAQVAIVLVSAAFRASKFIAENELPPLLARAKRDGVLILPVVVGNCDFDDGELAHVQAVNNPSKPLDTMPRPRRDVVWVDVVRRVKDALPDRHTHSQ